MWKPRTHSSERSAVLPLRHGRENSDSLDGRIKAQGINSFPGCVEHFSSQPRPCSIPGIEFRNPSLYGISPFGLFCQQIIEQFVQEVGLAPDQGGQRLGGCPAAEAAPNPAQGPGQQSPDPVWSPVGAPLPLKMALPQDA